jgi:hypothetical protein
MIENIHLVSLAFTPIVYFTAFIVLLHYGAAARAQAYPKTAVHWLVLGIVLNFIGKLLDNAYWNGSWAAFRWGDPTGWFTLGPVVNLVFRQGFLVVGGACHIVAAVMSAGDLGWRKSLLAAALAVALFVLMCVLGACVTPAC